MSGEMDEKRTERGERSGEERRGEERRRDERRGEERRQEERNMKPALVLLLLLCFEHLQPTTLLFLDREHTDRQREKERVRLIKKGRGGEKIKDKQSR